MSLEKIEEIYKLCELDWKLSRSICHNSIVTSKEYVADGYRAVIEESIGITNQVDIGLMVFDENNEIVCYWDFYDFYNTNTPEEDKAKLLGDAVRKILRPYTDLYTKLLYAIGWDDVFLQQ